jgi:hypothetical protein
MKRRRRRNCDTDRAVWKRNEIKVAARQVGIERKLVAN